MFEVFRVSVISSLRRFVLRDSAVPVNTDDELPDYIMVMVANRKTEEQMAEDLSLFLSSNTNKFTTWFVVQVVHVESLH